MTPYDPVLDSIAKNLSTLPPGGAYDFVYTFLHEPLGMHRAAEHYHRLAPIKPTKTQTGKLYGPKIIFTEKTKNKQEEIAKLYLALTKEIVNSHSINPLHPLLAPFFTPSKIYLAKGIAAALPRVSTNTVPVRFNYGNTNPASKKPGKNVLYADRVENVILRENRTRKNRLNTIVVRDADATTAEIREVVYNIIFTNADDFDAALNHLFDTHLPIVTTLIDGKNTTTDAINAVTSYYGIYGGLMVPVIFINNYTGKTINVRELKNKYPNIIVRINGEIKKIDTTHSGRGLIV